MIDYKKLSDIQLQQLAVSPDSAAEEALAERYVPLVSLCARPFHIAGAEKKDLMQEGMFGLLSAIRQYDPEQGSSFHTFAEHCIRMRLLSAVKSASRLKHFPLNDSMSYEQLSEDSDPRLSAVLEQFRSNPEDMVLARESKEELYSAFSEHLSPFEQRVLSLYLSGLSYQQIGTQLAKDSKSVDNAVQRIRRKLARNLNLGDISIR